MNQVASTILAQLGGNRFIAMTDAKNFVQGPDMLQFDIGRGATNKATKVRVTLTEADLYKLEFFRWNARAMTCDPKPGSVDGVYAEDLRRLFTDATGLDTHL